MARHRIRALGVAVALIFSASSGCSEETSPDAGARWGTVDGLAGATGDTPPLAAGAAASPGMPAAGTPAAGSPSAGGGATAAPPSGGSAGAPGGASGGPSSGAAGVGAVVADAGSTRADAGNSPLPDAGAAGTTPDAGTSAAPDAGVDAGTVVPSAGVLLGVYVGNTPSDVGAFERWLGRDVDGVLGYTGDASWQDYDGSVGWATGVWSAIDRPIFWSVPLIPRGATLEAAAAGDYDDHYVQAARTLAGYRPQDPVLHVRTGWEFNGDWFPWAARGKAQAFVGAFRHFVTAFRSVSDRFVFEWNVNVGDVGMDPETAYPGDDYVDIIGMDFYWNTQWDPSDPVEAWNSMVDRPWGLQWHQDFAAAHGKRTSYSEWGIMSNAAGPYIERAHAWFEEHDVVFHTYWDGNNAFQGKLSDGQYPAAGAAYRTAFGN